MVEPLRHRQTKGAETDMFDLPQPRHIPTLPRLNFLLGLLRPPQSRCHASHRPCKALCFFDGHTQRELFTEL
jgi:hypothetical protein